MTPIDQGRLQEISGGGLELRVEEQTLRAVVSRGDGNSFSASMTKSLAEGVVLAQADRSLRFVHLRADGPAFCLGRDREGETADELREVGARIVRLLDALRETSLIVICEVNGDAAGFGVGLVAASDVAVASDDAAFWFPELEAGLAPTVVLAWLARLVPRKLAFDLVATGRHMDAHEALANGLLTEVVAANEVGEAAERWIERLSAADAPALRDVKAFLGRAASLDEGEASRSAAELLALGSLRLQGR